MSDRHSLRTELDFFLVLSDHAWMDLAIFLGMRDHAPDMVHIVKVWSLFWSNPSQPKFYVADRPLKWSALNQYFQIGVLPQLDVRKGLAEVCDKERVRKT